MKFNELCDELGMDTISTGSVVGLAMDLTEKGIKDFGLRFGETEGYLKAPELICAKEGIGAELALGARAPGRPSTACPSSRWRSRTWSCRATTRAARSA